MAVGDMSIHQSVPSSPAQYLLGCGLTYTYQSGNWLDSKEHSPSVDLTVHKSDKTHRSQRYLNELSDYFEGLMVFEKHDRFIEPTINLK